MMWYRSLSVKIMPSNRNWSSNRRRTVALADAGRETAADQDARRLGNDRLRRAVIALDEVHLPKPLALFDPRPDLVEALLDAVGR
jgi:hypothetical protein